MATLHRLRRRLASEEGSFLIEALVTATILLAVSGGVVVALQTAHAQSGLQRAKALATDVAQTKLDELRSRTYNSLRPLNETATVTEGGITFTVVSTATPVTSQPGAPSGCSNQRARDYMSLKSTVTWTEMGARKPVVLDTLVAAPVGAGGGLIVNVTGGAGQAVSGIPIALSSGGGSATTDASGCARWDAVSAGSGYGLTASLAGYVQPNGVQDIAVSGISIVPEETAEVNLAYDRGGSVDVTFQQRVSGSSSPTNLPSGTLLPADVSLANASATVIKPVTPGSGGIGSAGLFYPFPSSYGVYADSCSAAAPTGAGLPAAALPGVAVPAGGSVATTLELPSLNIKLTKNGSLPTAADNVTVKVRTACGTAFTGRTVKTSDGTLSNPGLPYGTGFTVCAVDGTNSTRVVRTNVSNTAYAAPGPGATTINLTAGGTTCPF